MTNKTQHNGKNGREVYFDTMKSVSSKVGEFVLEKVKDLRLKTKSLEDMVEKIPQKRVESPKMRANLTYLVYRAYGGDKGIDEIVPLMALSELSNCYAYLDNWIFDNKKNALSSRSNLNLIVAAGEVLRDVTQQVIEELNLPDNEKREISLSLAHVNISCYDGQARDFMTTLDEAKKMDETSFLEFYEERAKLLSGGMYGFSTELGARLAGKSREDIENARKFGEEVGKGIQISNDLGDFALNSGETEFKAYQDQLSDLVENRATWPIYYALTRGTDEEKASLNVIIGNRNATYVEKEKASRAIVSTGAYSSTIKIINNCLKDIKRAVRYLPDNEWRDAVSSVASTLRCNKFLSTLKEYKGEIK